ncbi:MAG: hypothetical protein FWD99_03190 [Oscillospiraceae bacterium]|nr:hypothetical protein [Oscillospiraceae bacterium]
MATEQTVENTIKDVLSSVSQLLAELEQIVCDAESSGADPQQLLKSVRETTVKTCTSLLARVEGIA